METSENSPPTLENQNTSVSVRRALELLHLDNQDMKIQAAKDIRRLTKTSHSCRRELRQAITPLVSMLRVDLPESHEPALLALLNLAVQDEKYVCYLNLFLVFSSFSFLLIFNFKWIFQAYYLEEESNYTGPVKNFVYVFICFENLIMSIT